MLTDAISLIQMFFPVVLLFELPVYLMCGIGVLIHLYDARRTRGRDRFLPKVSCVITCYSEGKDVGMTIRSLLEQTYPGFIEILAVVDGAVQNRETYTAARAWQRQARDYPMRLLKVLPKKTRGGRVSSLNTGRQFATGEVVLALDGDTSFDNDMIWHITRPFADSTVAAVSGTLRVRNAAQGLAARLQALEYMLSIQLARTGLSAIGTVNNISGAFGAFRRSILERVGGWDAGSAEDLDMTLRIKKCSLGKEKIRIVHQPRAIGHTDVPATWRGFFKQRLRWDGDLYFIYVRKHLRSLDPRLLGWKTFLMLLWTGVYFQLIMPFAIVISTAGMIIVAPLSLLWRVMVLIYGFYTVLSLLLFLTYLLISERPGTDWKYLRFIPIFPLFTFATRAWSVYATLAEMFAKQHLDSAMAPWWVLKKTRF